MNNRKHGQGNYCTKMGADSLAENTPNVTKLIFPICLPNPKSLGFQWKKASLDVRSPCLLRLTAGLKQTFVTKHCRFVPIDTSFTLAWDKFDLFKQFLWNQSNESSDSRNQIRQHFCTLLFAVCYIFFRKKQHGEQIFTCHYHFL